MKPVFFATPKDFRRWLTANHASTAELLVGYYKKDSGRPSMTWPESVDEALCFGWIDGIRRARNAQSYTIRFTPRRQRSTWSAINVRRAKAMIKEGRMTPAGNAAFRKRKANRIGVYSYEQRPVDLTPPYRNLLRRNTSAWKFYQSQPPSYRKAAAWWILSAAREETRAKRLQQLLIDSEKGLRIAPLRPPSGLPKEKR
jgi:uncharacterized protein YdeI (YjbR/CyaY-like superfamily)